MSRLVDLADHPCGVKQDISAACPTQTNMDAVEVLETAEVVRLLEAHQIHADRARVWRVTDALGLHVRRGCGRRHWTADQAELVLLAVQLRIQAGLAPRAVCELALSDDAHPEPLVCQLRTVYQRVRDEGGVVNIPSPPAAA
jgi:hypothetical protein